MSNRYRLFTLFFYAFDRGVRGQDSCMNLFYFLYDKIIRLTYFLARLVIVRTSTKDSKKRRFVDLQDSSTSFFLSLCQGRDTKPRIWIHASSLGEYQIARPIIKHLCEEDKFEIVTTFFSPSGFDIISPLQGKDGNPDYVLPLPLDSKRKSEEFIESVRPALAIFLVSEYWPNYLHTLKRRGIPTLLYSVFSKPNSGTVVGNLFRKAMMKQFTSVVTHDRHSFEELHQTGIPNVKLLPDPLFDNAIAQRQKTFTDKTIERFIGGNSNVLIGGSLHIDKDLLLMAAVAKKYPETKIILVPHEVSKKNIERIIYEMPCKTEIYSLSRDKDFSEETQCLIIDMIGILAKIYRYGTGAYVGGGFTPLLHSLVEPLVYGIPIAFGPKIHRKPIAHILLQEGFGSIVKNNIQICKWWEDVISNHDKKEIQTRIDVFCSSQTGGAQQAIELINAMTQTNGTDNGEAT